MVGWVGDHELLLGDAVQSLSLLDQLVGEAVIEDSIADTQHGLGCALAVA